MILIADSGSTKTDWRLIDDNKNIHQFATQGINPYFTSSDEISLIIQNELLSQIQFPLVGTPLSVFFYGAGCGSDSKKEIVRIALLKNLHQAFVEVYSDMLGAARSLCGANPGIAAVLGTGANTCYYDGNNIIESTPSLGYVLGDEGSGAHIGKTFVQAFLNKEMPEALSNRFYERFNLGKEEMLDAIYKQPNPNRFLASFSKFIYQNLKEQFVVDLVANCFGQFFDKHICKYSKHKEVKLSCVGSVAFYYSNILRAVAANKGVNIETIIETPIAGLTLFHLGEE